MTQKEQRLRRVRRFYLRPLPLTLPLLVLALLAAWGSWYLVLLGIGAVLWVQGLHSVNRQIRRERSGTR